MAFFCKFYLQKYTHKFKLLVNWKRYRKWYLRWPFLGGVRVYRESLRAVKWCIRDSITSLGVFGTTLETILTKLVGIHNKSLCYWAICTYSFTINPILTPALHTYLFTLLYFKMALLSNDVCLLSLHRCLWI